MKYLLFTAIIFSAFSTKGRTLQPVNQLSNKIQQTAPYQSNAFTKTTFTTRRLIGYSYSINGEVLDSARYAYSGNRGSYHNTFPSSYFPYFNLAGIPMEQNIKYDTLHKWLGMSGGPNYLGYVTYTYNNNVMPTESIDISRGTPFKYEGTYNTANELIKTEVSDTFGSSTLTPKLHIYMSYDGQGRRISDSFFNSTSNFPEDKRTYHYDSNGNLDTFRMYTYFNNEWQLSLQQTNIYDADGRKLFQLTENDEANGFLPSKRDSFAYSGNAVHPVYHVIERWNTSSNNWEPFEKLMHTLNSNEQPDTTTVYQHNGQWYAIERNVDQYDNHNLLTQSNGYQSTGAGQFSTTPYDASYFYYEDIPQQSVAGTAQAKKAVIYPNPAKDVVNIATNNVRSMQIINITGQILFSSDNINNLTSVNIAAWPAGAYWVTTMDHNNTSSTASFVKY